MRVLWILTIIKILVMRCCLRRQTYNIELKLSGASNGVTQGTIQFRIQGSALNASSGAHLWTTLYME